MNNNTPVTISLTIEQKVRDYFQALDGEEGKNLYDLIVTEVEKPLLAVVMEHTKGNQSKSAKILGLNRGTLRKKLLQHDIIK